MRWNEEQVLTAEGLDGIALRYSLLYGPGPACRVPEVGLHL